jgi:tetratricopeptide (TPR) repeat protein
MRVLSLLADHHNEVVSKASLIEAVWGHPNVSDAALTRCIFEIRQAFGDNARESRVIETVPKIGYRLVGSLRNTRWPQRHTLGVIRTSLAVAALTVFMVIGNSSSIEDAGDAGSREPPTENTLAYDAYKKGMSFLLHGDLLKNENSIAMFERAIELDPDFSWAYIALSSSLVRHAHQYGGDRLDDAWEAANKGVELDPSLPHAHDAIGVLHLTSGDTDQALAAFERAYTMDPDHWRSAFHAARAHSTRAEYEQAKVLFEQSLRSAPNNVEAMTQLAFEYLRTSDIVSARRWLNAALDQEPRGIHPMTLMALLEMSVGDVDQSIEHCERVQKIVPRHQSCLYLLGVNNLIAGNNDDAQMWFERAKRNAQVSHVADLGTAQVLMADGKIDQGLEIIHSVRDKSLAKIESSETPWEEYRTIAASFALVGDTAKALEWLEKAADSGYNFYIWDVKDPALASLHGEPRFEKVMASSGP